MHLPSNSYMHVVNGLFVSRQKKAPILGDDEKCQEKEDLTAKQISAYF